MNIMEEDGYTGDCRTHAGYGGMAEAGRSTKNWPGYLTG